MTDVVKRHRHEINRLAESRRVRIEAVGCWVGSMKARKMNLSCNLSRSY